MRTNYTLITHHWLTPLTNDQIISDPVGWVRGVLDRYIKRQEEEVRFATALALRNFEQLLRSSVSRA